MFLFDFRALFLPSGENRRNHAQNRARQKANHRKYVGKAEHVAVYAHKYVHYIAALRVAPRRKRKEVYRKGAYFYKTVAHKHRCNVYNQRYD